MTFASGRSSADVMPSVASGTYRPGPAMAVPSVATPPCCAQDWKSTRNYAACHHQNPISLLQSLFIAVDDLNDWVNCMGGRKGVHTPNLDRLAARGVLFTNAHCAAPSCNPSRVAIMTGVRPSSSGVYYNGQSWRQISWPNFQHPLHRGLKSWKQSMIGCRYC